MGNIISTELLKIKRYSVVKAGFIVVQLSRQKSKLFIMN